MLFGAIGLLTQLLAQKQISQMIFNDFMLIIYADDETQQAFIMKLVQQFQHKPIKRGRKKLDIKIIVENLPIILSDAEIEKQDDALNWTFLNNFHHA